MLVLIPTLLRVKIIFLHLKKITNVIHIIVVNLSDLNVSRIIRKYNLHLSIYRPLNALKSRSLNWTPTGTFSLLPHWAQKWAWKFSTPWTPIHPTLHAPSHSCHISAADCMQVVQKFYFWISCSRVEVSKLSKLVGQLVTFFHHCNLDLCHMFCHLEESFGAQKKHRLKYVYMKGLCMRKTRYNAALQSSPYISFAIFASAT